MPKNNDENFKTFGKNSCCMWKTPCFMNISPRKRRDIVLTPSKWEGSYISTKRIGI
jgi:hypothetical protein